MKYEIGYGCYGSHDNTHWVDIESGFAGVESNNPEYRSRIYAPGEWVAVWSAHAVGSGSAGSRGGRWIEQKAPNGYIPPDGQVSVVGLQKAYDLDPKFGNTEKGSTP